MKTAWILLLAFGMKTADIPLVRMPHLKRVAGVSAENGMVAIQGDVMTVFPDGDIFMQDSKNSEWRLDNSASTPISIRFGPEPRRISAHLPVTAAHDFALCDALNQLDIGSTDSSLRSLFSAGSKIKSISRVSQSIIVVVYSTSPNKTKYDIRVAGVRQSSPSSYSMIDSSVVTDSGNFCGVQMAASGLFFVFADEPSGSSDFSAVYAYVLSNATGKQR